MNRKITFNTRQQQVANMLAAGLSNKQIANACGISYRAVCNATDQIYKKLNVNNRTRAAILINEINRNKDNKPVKVDIDEIEEYVHNAMDGVKTDDVVRKVIELTVEKLQASKGVNDGKIAILGGRKSGLEKAIDQHIKDIKATTNNGGDLDVSKYTGVNALDKVRKCKLKWKSGDMVWGLEFGYQELCIIEDALEKRTALSQQAAEIEQKDKRIAELLEIAKRKQKEHRDFANKHKHYKSASSVHHGAANAYEVMAGLLEEVLSNIENKCDEQ